MFALIPQFEGASAISFSIFGEYDLHQQTTFYAL